MAWEPEARIADARRLAVALLLALLAAFLPAAATARPVIPAQLCHASTNASQTPSDVTRAGLWTCSSGGWSIAGESLYLRFTLDHAEPSPRSFVTLATRYSRVTMWVIDAGGAVRTATLAPDAARHLPTGPLMVMPLPPTSAATRTVIVRISHPWTKAAGSEARLDSSPAGSGWPIQQVVAMAVICGLLVVPLLLNGSIYAALPERFVLWHLALTGSMLVQMLIGTGFIHLLVDLPETVEGPLSNTCYAVMASAALMFAADFIEPGTLPRRLRRLLRHAAAAIFAVGMLAATPLAAMRPYSTLLLHLDMVPAILLFGLAAFVAWRRGSRAAVYQAIGWGPMVMAGLWKIACYILPPARPTDATVVYQLGLAVQVLVTTLGIINRFGDIRRERDYATARARELEGVAGHDPLTGLRNRRSIEKRFEDLLDNGFRTMAVLDLDHFKAINDSHGHAVGDDVLRAAAGALVDDADTRAIRMGGEEFMLLLRGSDAAERAERCRRAISTRISAEVPGLDRMVTASMGLVEHDRAGRLHVDFAALYAHCDRLLYEAKRLGRNRTMRERVTGFTTDRTDLRVVG